jgi:hypothetical protein
VVRRQEWNLGQQFPCASAGADDRCGAAARIGDIWYTTRARSIESLTDMDRRNGRNEVKRFKLDRRPFLPDMKVDKIGEKFYAKNA